MAREKGLAGVMVWEAGQDNPAPEKSLLAALMGERRAKKEEL